MKNYLYLFMLFGVNYLLQSCEVTPIINTTPTKLPHTIIEGTVTAFGTGKPVEKAMVIILEQKLILFSGGFPHTLDTVYTDAEGHYRYEVMEKKDYFYALEAGGEQYFSIYHLDIPSLKPFEYNKRDLVLDPKAYIELHIKNVKPFNEIDRLVISGDWSLVYEDVFQGNNIDKTLIREVTANRTQKFKFLLTKNDIKTTIKDSIYCPAFDTVRYDLNY